MSYTLQRCEDCNSPIDDDDEDYRPGFDDPALCGVCNAHYRHPLERQ
jgi:hypothetical protein